MRAPLSHLSDLAVDVLVIGAGINGASAAQHLAASGHDVLLVDKADFGAAATARSSRLLHCGLRYLAPGRSLAEFLIRPDRLLTALRMARQAMMARAELVHTVPERVAAMRFCFPIYRDGPYRPWQIDTAFKILAGLGAGGRVPLDYERLSPAAAMSRPLLRALRDPERLQAVACFREYQIDWPERLCLDAVLDAERCGARVRNYTSAALLGSLPGGGWQVRLSDTLGTEPPVDVTARRILNLAGTGIDAVTRGIVPHARRRVVGTKGAHILVRLPTECAGTGIATLSRRGEPFYCIPWRGLHFFGPTETLYEGDPHDARVTPDEAAFLLGEARHLLPGCRLSPEAVVASWAGVRPLTYDPALPLGRRSRELHDLGADGLPGVFALTAGPVMSHRSAGRLLADTATRGLIPRRGAQAVRYSGPEVPPRPVGEALRPGTPSAIADLQCAVEREHAATLADVLFRRTGAAWGEPLASHEIACAAATVGEVLGWDTATRRAAVEAYVDEVSRLFGSPFAPSLLSPSDLPTVTAAFRQGDHP